MGHAQKKRKIPNCVEDHEQLRFVHTYLPMVSRKKKEMTTRKNYSFKMRITPVARYAKNVVSRDTTIVKIAGKILGIMIRKKYFFKMMIPSCAIGARTKKKKNPQLRHGSRATTFFAHLLTDDISKKKKSDDSKKLLF